VARSKFAPDRGLTVRMVMTMVLLALLYVVLVAAISLHLLMPTLVGVYASLEEVVFAAVGRR
jgi:hypothetical protein